MPYITLYLGSRGLDLQVIGLLFTGTTSNVGAITGSVNGGAIAAALGLPFLFALAGFGYAVGGVLAWRALVLRGGAARPAATPPGDIASA
jgi:hypothetical protein